MFSLLEYIKIHRISLQQDMESEDLDPSAENYDARVYLQTQINTLDHLIKVAEETG
jgi:hypothetical protein